jgi:hypothetical protein
MLYTAVLYVALLAAAGLVVLCLGIWLCPRT